MWMRMIDAGREKREEGKKRGGREKWRWREGKRRETKKGEERITAGAGEGRVSE